MGISTQTAFVVRHLTYWWGKTNLAMSIVRFKAFDDTSPEGRSKERFRRIAITSISAIAAKGVAVLTSLISVPLTLHYLGNERYGLWMTISSIIAMLGFADFGMGNGLLNAIAEADGKNDKDGARRSVSSASFMLLGIAACFLLAFGSVYWVVPWERVYNLKSLVAIREAGPATAVMIVTFVISMPLGIVQRVQLGYQDGFSANLWTAAGGIFGLLAVLGAVYCEAGLPWLVLAMSGGPVLALALQWVDVFSRARRWLLPQWASFDWPTSRKLAGTGALFMILQLCAVLGNFTDSIVIAHVINISAVAGYAVVQKLFSITLVAQFFVVPLWPAFGEAIARNDHAWAHRTLNRALTFSLGLGVCTAVPLCLYGKEIITLWAGAGVVPSTFLLLGFAFWALLASYGGVMGAFLNSGELMGAQTRFYALSSIVALILKVVLAYNWQVAGVIWATVLGYGAFYVIPAAKLAYGSLKNIKPLLAPAI